MGSRGSGSGKAGGGAKVNNQRPEYPKSPQAISREMKFEDVPFEDALIQGGKVTKKAEEEFGDSYYQARNIIKDQGYFEGASFGQFYDMKKSKGGYTQKGWSFDYSTQTLKGIQQKINNEKSHLRMSLKFGVITPVEASQRKQALAMVQKTLNNSVKALQAYKRGE